MESPKINKPLNAIFLLYFAGKASNEYMPYMQYSNSAQLSAFESPWTATFLRCLYFQKYFYKYCLHAESKCLLKKIKMKVSYMKPLHIFAGNSCCQ